LTKLCTLLIKLKSTIHDDIPQSKDKETNVLALDCVQKEKPSRVVTKQFETSLQVDGRKSFSNPSFAKIYKRGHAAAWDVSRLEPAAEEHDEGDSTPNNIFIVLYDSRRPNCGSGYVGQRRSGVKLSAYYSGSVLSPMCIASDTLEYNVDVYTRTLTNQVSSVIRSTTVELCAEFDAGSAWTVACKNAGTEVTADHNNSDAIARKTHTLQAQVLSPLSPHSASSTHSANEIDLEAGRSDQVSTPPETEHGHKKQKYERVTCSIEHAYVVKDVFAVCNRDEQCPYMYEFHIDPLVRDRVSDADLGFSEHVII